MKKLMLLLLVVPLVAQAGESPKQCIKRMELHRYMCIEDCDEITTSTKKEKDACFQYCRDAFKKDLETDCGLKPQK